MNLLKLIFLSGLGFQIACAVNPVIKDKEYGVSEILYDEGSPGEALEKFPSKEKGGFITSIEKSWLEFWHEKWNSSRLEKLKDTSDERNFISVTREVGYFLWQEAEDGYIPSEHEWIILNLVRAQHFIQEQKLEKAKVELRQAQRLLEQHWDDPALKLWLGSLWASLGEWEEAQVDFRIAQHPLGSGKAPERIFLHFSGAGPELTWKVGEYEPEFHAGTPGDIEYLTNRFSTLPWFERHRERNHSLRDLMIKSNYQSQYLGSEVLTSVEKGVNHSAEWAVKAAGVFLGGAIVGVGLYAVLNSSAAAAATDGVYYSIFGAASAVTVGGWKLGEHMGVQGRANADRRYERKMEALRIYRCLRFMPTWMGISTEPTFDSPLDKKIVLKGKGGTEVVLVNHF